MAAARLPAHPGIGQPCQYHLRSHFLLGYHFVKDNLREINTAAFSRAEAQGLPVEPTTPEEVIHDLRDEARFHQSRTIRSEDLVSRAVAMGADGIMAFLRAVCSDQIRGLHSINKHDVFSYMKGVLQDNSSTDNDRPLIRDTALRLRDKVRA